MAVKHVAALAFDLSSWKEEDDKDKDLKHHLYDGQHACQDNCSILQLQNANSRFSAVTGRFTWYPSRKWGVLSCMFSSRSRKGLEFLGLRVKHNLSSHRTVPQTDQCWLLLLPMPRCDRHRPAPYIIPLYLYAKPKKSTPSVPSSLYQTRNPCFQLLMFSEPGLSEAPW